MKYAHISTIKPKEIGMRKGAHVGAPMIIHEGLDSVYIPDTNNNIIYLADLLDNKSRKISDTIPSKHNTLENIKGLAKYGAQLLVTSGNKEMLIFNEYGNYSGSSEFTISLPREKDTIGPIAVSEVEDDFKLLWGGSYKYSMLACRMGSSIYYAQHIENDINDYNEVGHEGFISAIAPVEEFIAVLLSCKKQEGKIFLYSYSKGLPIEAKKEEEITVGNHNNAMIQHNGLLYVATGDIISIYNPNTKEKINEITAKGMNHPTSIAADKEHLIIASEEKNTKDSLEFRIFRILDK